RLPQPLRTLWDRRPGGDERGAAGGGRARGRAGGGGGARGDGLLGAARRGGRLGRRPGAPPNQPWAAGALGTEGPGAGPDPVRVGPGGGADPRGVPSHLGGAAP